MAVGNSSCIFIVLILISLVYDVFSDRVSHTRTCADPTCHTVISEAIALYQNKQEGSLPFEVNDRIKVLSKGVGKDQNLWGGLIKGQIAYFQKHLVKETQVFVENLTFTVKPGDTDNNNKKNSDDDFLKEAQKTYEQMEMKNKGNDVTQEEKKSEDPTEFDETDETDISSDTKTKTEQDITDMDNEEKDLKTTETKPESVENEKKEEGVDARNIDNKGEKNIEENEAKKNVELENPETPQTIEKMTDDTTTDEKILTEENAKHSTKEEEVVENSMAIDNEHGGKGAEADIKMSETKTDVKEDVGNPSDDSSIQPTSNLNTEEMVTEKPATDLESKTAQDALSDVQPTVTSQSTNSLDEDQSLSPSVPDENGQDNTASITNLNLESVSTDSTQTTATEEAQQNTMTDTTPPPPTKDDKPLEAGVADAPLKNNENNENVPASNKPEENNSHQMEDQVHVNDGTTTMVLEGATTILPPDEEVEASVIPTMPSSLESENNGIDKSTEAIKVDQASSESKSSETELKTENPSAHIESASQSINTEPSSIEANISDTSQTLSSEKASPSTETIPENTQPSSEKSIPKEESTTIETPPPEVTIGTVETKEPIEPPVQVPDVNSTSDQPVTSESSNNGEELSKDNVDNLKQEADTKTTEATEKTTEADSETVTPTPSIIAEADSTVTVNASVFSGVDRSMMNIIEMMPGVLQFIFTSEPIGLSAPRTFLLASITTMICFVFGAKAVFCKSNPSKLPDPHAAARKLEHQLHILQREKDQIEDENNRLKADIGSLSNRSNLSSRDVTKLKEQLSRSQADSHSYQTQIHELQQQVEQISASVGAKHMENVQLKEEYDRTVAEYHKLKDTSSYYENQLAEKVNQFEQSHKSQETLELQVQQMTEEVSVLQQSRDQLLLDVDKWKERINDSKEELGITKNELEALKETIESKDNEISVLKDCIINLQSSDDDDELGEKEKLQRLEKTIDVAKISAELKVFKEDNESLRRKYEVEIESRKGMEVQFEEIKKKCIDLEEMIRGAKREKEEAQLKLDVLSNYFKEKETSLQREIGEREVLRTQASSMLSREEQDREMAEKTLEIYKQQVDDLKKEITNLEQDFRRQNAIQEKKAHETWLSARRAERGEKEAKAEASFLRQRLLELESRHENIVRPVPTLPETLNGGRAPLMAPIPPPMPPMPQNPMMDNRPPSSHNSLREELGVSPGLPPMPPPPPPPMMPMLFDNQQRFDRYDDRYSPTYNRTNRGSEPRRLGPKTSSPRDPVHSSRR
ncbi:DgyrCDS6906 [Dimorphilus gyrociliatus]|uniref:DgyrCDS6906 n=1 Tax=Dimorphilus gyrociliatus TaxID=2664684 RepID=A0A7I8VPD3_9ANNE|nr:DgyrCDS6906 [Dimorphilus gyrociliatus]